MRALRSTATSGFILSAEIIVISLGAVAGEGFAVRLGVLASIAAIMTVGVYGLVAAIVRLDDAGLALIRREGAFARGLGRAILTAAPWLMKFLSIAGTTAMFLVGGGIVAHGVPALHHVQQEIAHGFSGASAILIDLAYVGTVGLILGALVLLAVETGRRLFGRVSIAH